MSKVWDPKHQQIREYLRNIRKQQGYSQTELADKLHKPQSYVSKYETGERSLDFIETIQVCEACGIYNLETLIDIAKTSKQ